MSTLHTSSVLKWDATAFYFLQPHMDEQQSFSLFKWPQHYDCNSAESLAIKPFNHQLLFLLKSQSISFQRTDGDTHTHTLTPTQSYTLNRFQNKEEGKHLLSSYWTTLNYNISQLHFKREDVAVSVGRTFEKLMAPRVSSLRPGVFCSLHNANHRWDSSLGAIDRPHKTESVTPPKGSAATI